MTKPQSKPPQTMSKNDKYNTEHQYETKDDHLEYGDHKQSHMEDSQSENHRTLMFKQLYNYLDAEFVVAAHNDDKLDHPDDDQFEQKIADDDDEITNEQQLKQKRKLNGLCVKKTADDDDEITNEQQRKQMEKVKGTLCRRNVTQSMLDKTKWNDIKKHKGCIGRVELTISKQRWNEECKQGEIIVIDQNMRHWPDYLKIVDIASEGNYIGLKYGYDQIQLSEIIEWLNNDLPIDLATIVIEFCMEMVFKSFILDPLSVMEITGFSCKEMKKYHTW
eukprot:CAMPEP_0201594474 /NCGR_PEP_ID=MMETSP0190_2-20130828/191780_1 /ASSEMBLY_ACC=CAM_ASM_000263 /TAXON_ID=37353 /ORGANISM="Rosalina sp." /LENGTH=275 /DNA_ID=CAMNT_0048054099 /DNA_START=39 /DNA_END=864 /DNA_ORIENTATION=-